MPDRISSVNALLRLKLFSSRGGYRGGPGGGYNNRGGFQPRGGPPRNPAPWQQHNNFGNNFGPRGGFPGFPPPPAVNIPSTKPPPPPEEPPETAPWEQSSGNTGNQWGMMPPVMPPWVSLAMWLPSIRFFLEKFVPHLLLCSKGSTVFHFSSIQ